MTALLDFAMLPPEVNSGRMYSGAGAGPMLAAAGAWNGLAAELRATALGCSSVLSELTSQAWHGPASASMAAAVAPYVAWLSTSAAQAEETAAQAEAAVAAYEAAFAATVPPPVIAANRAQLMALIATNFFGQNTPAIAATEAQYAEMWAQDAAAMYGYAGASALASQLTPFQAPRQATDPAGPPAQSAAVSQAAATSAGTGQSTVSQLMSVVPGTLRSLAAPVSTPQAAAPAATGGSALDNLLNSPIWNNFGPNATIWNSIFASGFYMPSQIPGHRCQIHQPESTSRRRRARRRGGRDRRGGRPRSRRAGESIGQRDAGQLRDGQHGQGRSRRPAVSTTGLGRPRAAANPVGLDVGERTRGGAAHASDSKHASGAAGPYGCPR